VLGAVLVYGRDEDVAGLVVVQLDDGPGEVRLERCDSLLFEVLIKTDFVGGHGFDLDCAGFPDQPGDDGVGLLGIAGPVNNAAAGGEILFETVRGVPGGWP
jgi:hypothetical protein